MSEKTESNSESFKLPGYDYVGTLHVNKGMVTIESTIPFITFLAAMSCIFPDHTLYQTKVQHKILHMYSGNVITSNAIYINNGVVEKTNPSVWPAFPWCNPYFKKDWTEMNGEHEFRLFQKKQ